MSSPRQEITVYALRPYEVDPQKVAEHLLFTSPRWRWLRRRRLEREIARLAATREFRKDFEREFFFGDRT